MARIFTFFAFALVLIYVKAEEEERDCICLEYTDEEKQQIWDFLQKVSGEMSDEDGILPALLSPIVPCGNCLDGARRKRTVLPPVVDREEFDSGEDILMPKADSRCPVGYARIAFRCISLSDLYKKK